MPRKPGRTPRGLQLEKFFAQVDKTNTCWLWTGEVKKRYSRYGGWSAYRLSYEEFVGPIPTGMEIDHLCRNTICVNPSHLEAVTTEENIRRRVAARTHCKNGHEYTPENTGMRPGTGSGNGGRVCRKCVVIRHREYVNRKRLPNASAE